MITSQELLALNQPPLTSPCLLDVLLQGFHPAIPSPAESLRQPNGSTDYLLC